MTKLVHSKVFRGGATAKYLRPEVTDCTFDPNASEGSLDFRFKLASKGGGTTETLLRVGLKDLPMIVKATATAMPEGVGELLGTHIWLDKKGVAWIDSTRVKVSEVAAAHFAYDWGASHLHEQYPHLSLAQIHAALAYIYDNPKLVKSELIAQEDLVTAWRKELGESPLQQRLYQLKRER